MNTLHTMILVLTSIGFSFQLIAVFGNLIPNQLMKTIHQIHMAASAVYARKLWYLIAGTIGQSCLIGLWAHMGWSTVALISLTSFFVWWGECITTIVRTEKGYSYL